MTSVSTPPVRRERMTRYIKGDGFVVAVDVSVIYAPEEPDDPLLEADTLRFLDEVTERVEKRDMGWLRRVGAVYVRSLA